MEEERGGSGEWKRREEVVGERGREGMGEMREKESRGG